jgi:hypothetical protein
MPGISAVQPIRMVSAAWDKETKNKIAKIGMIIFKCLDFMESSFFDEGRLDLPPG